MATALDHYRQALALAPDDATLHNNAGTALAGLGNYPAAAAAFEAAGLAALEVDRESLSHFGSTPLGTLGLARFVQRVPPVRSKPVVSP